MKFDDVFDDIGAFGPFQLYAFMLVGMWGFWSYQGTAAPFVVFPLDHWCRVPALQNLSWEQQKYISAPADEDGGYEKCHR